MAERTTAGMVSPTAGDTSKQVLDSTPDISYLVSPEGVFLDVNPSVCRVLRQPHEKIVGSRVTLHMDRDHAAVAERVLKDIVGRRTAERSTRTYQVPGFEPQTFEVMENPLIQDGRVWAIAGVGRDISQEVILEHKLWDTEESRQTVVDFAVRTSLGLVKGYVYALGQNQLMDDHHRARYVRIIEEEIDHLAKIIEDMLDVRRMESGRYELNWDAVDIRECVRVVECQCEEEALRRRIEVVVRMPETMEPLYLPREAISRVMLNLLLNGIHHTLHNGKVWLTVEDHDLYIEISVKDNGVGIPESEIPYIFDKFYRGRNSASSNLMGPGLGLTIVRTLVEAMGGKIHVGSAVGAGTDFRMVLPRQPVGVLDPNDTQAPKLPSAAPDAPATL